MPASRSAESWLRIFLAWFRIRSGNSAVPTSVSRVSSLRSAAAARRFSGRFRIGSENVGHRGLAVVDRTGLGQRASEGLLEQPDRPPAHVEHLLVDGERERRVGVPREVHRPPRRHIADGEDRRERSPQRVRRHVRDLDLTLGVEQRVGPLTGSARGSASGCCRGSVACRCGSGRPASPHRSGIDCGARRVRGAASARWGRCARRRRIFVADRGMRSRSPPRSMWGPSSPQSSETRRPPGSASR